MSAKKFGDKKLKGRKKRIKDSTTQGIPLDSHNSVMSVEISCPSEESVISSPQKRKQDLKLPFPELDQSNCSADGPIKCGKCYFRTDSEAEIILHSINHTFASEASRTGSKIRCPTCDHLFAVKNIRRHVYVHTSEKPFKCKTCSIEFTSRRTLKGHEIIHRTTGEITADEDQIATCDLCGASFASNARLRKHSLIHSEDRLKNIMCDICGDSFYDRETLRGHVIRIHERKTSRRFKCEFEGCRYTSVYHHQLMEHQKVHSDDKPFVCDQCNYRAKSKWTFKKHYRKHTQEKPFKCQICEYATSLSSNLTRHIRTHTGSKPFKCPYCNYSCNNHENLRKHVLNTKKHAGLFLYNCQHCGFETNAFLDLRQHIEAKHQDMYTTEEIDRMISSVYHKNEDNTLFVTDNCENVSEDQNKEYLGDDQVIEFQYISQKSGIKNN